jgi:hypothetical protein
MSRLRTERISLKDLLKNVEGIFSEREVHQHIEQLKEDAEVSTTHVDGLEYIELAS